MLDDNPILIGLDKKDSKLWMIISFSLDFSLLEVEREVKRDSTK
jgi:hypothetical protein